MARFHKHKGIYDYDGYMLNHSINRKHYKDETILAHQEEENHNPRNNKGK